MSYRSSVQLSEKRRKALCDSLNQVLANAVDLYTQSKQAHWNVKGRHFISTHELLDQLAKHSRKHADDFAERIATLGGYARGSARYAAQYSELPEFAPESLRGHDIIEEIVECVARYTASLRDAIERAGDEIGDPATEDLLIEKLRQAEFDMWFLEAHLESDFDRPQRYSRQHADRSNGGSRSHPPS